MSTTVTPEHQERIPLTRQFQGFLAPEPEDRKNLIELGLVFIALVASVYLIGWVAWKTWGLPEGSPTSLIHSVFDRWDVLNYALIAEHGYRVSEHQAVWFPALPAAMRVGHWLGLPYWLAGTLLVIPCAATLTWVFYRLVRLDFESAVSRDATLLLLVFPASFFLFVPYTEALFMVLAIGSFYCARKRNWLPAAVLAGMASGVRTTGMFLLPALIVEYGSSIEWQVKRVRLDAAWLALAPAGLLVFMAYSEWRLDDALAFYHAQDKVPHLETIQAESGFPDFIPSLLNRVRMLWLSNSQSEIYMNVAGLSALAFFGATFFGMLYYQLRPSYLVFSLPAVTSSLPIGRVDSVNRYVLYAFPIFIVLALMAQRWPFLRTPWICLSLAALYMSAMRFATNEWAG